MNRTTSPNLDPLCRSSRRRFRRRGNAILELTLTLGILLSLTFGAIEFGHYFYVQNTLQGAAREGARAAIPAAANNGDVHQAVNASLTAAGVKLANYTVEIRNATDTANVNVATQAAGTGILVKVSGTWGSVGIRPMGLIGKTKVVRGAAVMRKETT
jgi:Flp pilus assembly protein TadG